MKYLIRLIVFFLFLTVSFFSSATNIWYEDNNLGKSGGMPDDFISKFHEPESFAEATKYMDVYMIRSHNLTPQLDDEFFVDLLKPYLQKNNIKLALDLGGANWAQIPGRERVRNKELKLLKRLKKFDINVDFISLQSVLSKNPKIKGEAKNIKNRDFYPLDKRIVDIVAFVESVRAIYPEVKIGLIDALPSHGIDYRNPYTLVKDALAKSGAALSYIHLDVPFDIPKTKHRGVTWKKIRAVEDFVENQLGITFGLLATSRKGGYISSKAYHDRVMATLECYSGLNGTPADYIIASWFPYPKYTIPENATGDEFPTMRTVREFGRKLENIEAYDDARVSEKINDPSWRGLCGIDNSF